MKTSRKTLLVSLAFAVIYIGSVYLLKNTSAFYWVEGAIIAIWMYAIGRVSKKERKSCTFWAKEL